MFPARPAVNTPRVSARPGWHRWHTAGLIALVWLLLLLAYGPGLAGPFLFDDDPNLLTNRSIASWLAHRESLWSVLAAAHAGPLGRPLAVLSLALQAQASGFHPLPFKLFNLLVHFVNTLLVLWLASQLLEERKHAWGWPLSAALLWALHPLAFNPVLYVVQRMSSLSALGMLLALNLMVLAHRQLARGLSARRLLWIGVPLAGLLGLLAKENALLLPAYVLVLNATLLSADDLPPSGKRTWKQFVRLAGWLPMTLGAVALVLFWQTLSHGFANRDFTLAERLLTEARVFWLYLDMLVWPRLDVLGLYHDDLQLSTGWLMPVSTTPAVLGLGVVSLMAWRFRRQHSWWAFAWGFLLASQLLESTVVPLELMHEHRMYLGMVAPILAFTHFVRNLVLRLTDAQRLQRVPLLDRLMQSGQPALILLPVVLALMLLTHQRADSWSNPLVMMEVEAAHHPRSLHAVYELAGLYGTLAERESDASERKRLFALAERANRQALALAPQLAISWVGLMILCSEANCTAPPDSFARLQALLRQGARADLMAANLRALVECRVHGPCQFPSVDLRTSLRALAQNPQLNPADRALLHEQWLLLDDFDAGKKGAT